MDKAKGTVMIITLLTLTLWIQEADRPPAPGQDALSQQAQPLRRTSTDDRSANTGPDTLQEQAELEREDNDESQTQAPGDAAGPVRRQRGPVDLRPLRQPDPGN